MLRSVRLWAPVSSLAQHATAGRVRKMTDTTSNGGGKHDEGGPQSVPTGPPSTISNAAKIVDVQGGQLSEAKPEEGQLPFAERAKNIIVAAKRFQLVTYNKLPGTKDNTDAVFSDPNLPVRGAYHAESNTIAVLLREQNPSEKKHMENVAKIANASLGAGHIDPPKLLPVFTRIGLMPPTVRVVGDLVQAPPERVDTLRNVLRENLEEGSSLDGDIYQLECGGAVRHCHRESLTASCANTRARTILRASECGLQLFADITPERTTTVPARDFRMAEIDPTAKDRNQAIEYGDAAGPSFWRYRASSGAPTPTDHAPGLFHLTPTPFGVR
jgi:hypothetical protein